MFSNVLYQPFGPIRVWTWGNGTLFEELQTAGIRAHMVADCRGTGYILGAVRNAADVAARIREGNG